MLTTARVSQHLEKYIKTVQAMNKATAEAYNFRLGYFDSFVTNNYRINLDDVVQQIKKGSQDPYDILNNYICYLQQNSHVSPLTLKQSVVTVKNFLEYNDVDISPRKFKLKVKFPKAIRKDKEALSKKDIVNILNSCSNIRLKTYVMLLASTGARATEALSIRVKDIDFRSDGTAKLFIRGEFTKTKTDRFVFLTEEMTKQFTTWLDYRYRTRRICHIDKDTEKTVIENRTPKKNPDDLVFVVNIRPGYPALCSLYNELITTFGKTRQNRNGYKGGGEFFTPREVVRLLVNLVEPKEGMSICDPTCGSGGMLIESRKYMEQTGGDPRNLVLEGQGCSISFRMQQYER